MVVDGLVNSEYYQRHENERGKIMVCTDLFNCCDCGGEECGCTYCWSCKACDECLNDNEVDCENTKYNM